MWKTLMQIDEIFEILLFNFAINKLTGYRG